jgi:hypothetical protein
MYSCRRAEIGAGLQPGAAVERPAPEKRLVEAVLVVAIGRGSASITVRHGC